MFKSICSIMCIQYQAHVSSILHTWNGTNDYNGHMHSLMFGGFQLQSWSCLCIFFADLLFRPWHIPQDTCRAEDSFRHQTHPYFPSWEMSGCKLTHSIVSVWQHLTFPWHVQVSRDTLPRSQDIKMSLQYTVSRRLVGSHCTPGGVTLPSGINDWGIIQPRESLIPLTAVLVMSDCELDQGLQNVKLSLQHREQTASSFYLRLEYTTFR